MLKLLVVIILMAIFCSTAYAKLPQVGDRVIVEENGISGTNHYYGTINDIENGFLCLEVQVNKDDPTEGVYDGCIGIGTIREIVWCDENWQVIRK